MSKQCYKCEKPLGFMVYKNKLGILCKTCKFAEIDNRKPTVNDVEKWNKIKNFSNSLMIVSGVVVIIGLVLMFT